MKNLEKSFIENDQIQWPSWTFYPKKIKVWRSTPNNLIPSPPKNEKKQKITLQRPGHFRKQIVKNGPLPACHVLPPVRFKPPWWAPPKSRRFPWRTPVPCAPGPSDLKGRQWSKRRGPTCQGGNELKHQGCWQQKISKKRVDGNERSQRRLHLIPSICIMCIMTARRYDWPEPPGGFKCLSLPCLEKGWSPLYSYLFIGDGLKPPVGTIQRLAAKQITPLLLVKCQSSMLVTQRWIIPSDALLGSEGCLPEENQLRDHQWWLWNWDYTRIHIYIYHSPTNIDRAMSWGPWFIALYP